MTSLMNQILSQNTRPAVNGCGLVRFLAELKPEDRKDLEQAMQDETITGSAIQRALRNNGYAISGNMIRRHRRKDCPCGNTC
jgi:hypothetical protein